MNMAMIDYSFPLEELEYYLLIFTRVSLFIFTAPFFGQSNVPRRVRVLMSIFIAFLLYEVLTPHIYIEYQTILGYTTYVLKEAICGALLGLGAQFCMMIVSFAGHLVDMEIGLSMVSLMDPTTKQNVTITGAMYTYVFTLLFLVSGMYRYLIQVLCETFTLVPVGEASFQLDVLYNGILTFLTRYILLGFQVMIPVFVTILLTNCLLGIMAKVSPQMNMFSVGIQIKLMAGLGVIYFTVTMLPHAADLIFNEMKVMIVTMVKAFGGGA
ncbi:MAG: flagellar biosynthetic protein FliR [Lachnospiraceae bacterium]|nr:flagellar biosynthetic protein FliR [Lachnospiraceae bacterium]